MPTNCRQPFDLGIDRLDGLAYTMIYAFKRSVKLAQVAKLFTNGRSQAVRLPAAFRFDAKEVFVRQDPATGDVILSRKPPSWDEFFELVTLNPAPKGLLVSAERAQDFQERDPFEGWVE